jgi:hypothetical protein
MHQPRAAEFVDRDEPDAPIRYVNVGCFRDTGRVLQVNPRSFETVWIEAE